MKLGIGLIGETGREGEHGGVAVLLPGGDHGFPAGDGLVDAVVRLSRTESLDHEGSTKQGDTPTRQAERRVRSQEKTQEESGGAEHQGVGEDHDPANRAKAAERFDQFGGEEPSGKPVGPTHGEENQSEGNGSEESGSARQRVGAETHADDDGGEGAEPRQEAGE